MHTDSKWKQSPLRTSSNTSYLTQTRKVPFRTIIKRRNDTISTSQLYQESPNSKDKNTARQLSHSQILSQKQIDPPSPSVDIKDYVKKMVGKQETHAVGCKNYQVETSRQQDDKLSQRSSRSVMSNSRLGKKEGALLGKPERGAFEQLEKRVEGLIAETLGQFKRQKSTIGLAQWLKTEPGQDETRQKELEQLMSWMKELTEKEEIPGQKIDDLNKKIALIEKLQARQSVEAEFLQGMYFNWKAQRGNTTSFLSKSVLKESKKYNKHSEDHQRRINKQAARSKQIVSKYDSMNTTSYKRPAKEFYIASKEKKSSYSANRQPFPRSSYSAQYLNYGQLAPYTYKPDEGKQYPETSLAVKASTYQEEYTEKLGITKKIDFKELDCYKDKFQNPKISFINSSKKQPCTKIIDRKSKGKDIKQNMDAAYIKKSQESLLGYMSMSSSNFYRTQSQKQYLWHNSLATQSTKDLQIKSQIKDKRLQKLKDSFRALAMRRQIYPSQ